MGQSFWNEEELRARMDSRLECYFSHAPFFPNGATVIMLSNVVTRATSSSANFNLPIHQCSRIILNLIPIRFLRSCTLKRRCKKFTNENWKTGRKLFVSLFKYYTENDQTKRPQKLKTYDFHHFSELNKMVEIFCREYDARHIFTNLNIFRTFSHLHVPIYILFFFIKNIVFYLSFSSSRRCHSRFANKMVEIFKSGLAELRTGYECVSYFYEFEYFGHFDICTFQFTFLFLFY